MLKTLKIAAFFFLLYCSPSNQVLYWASILLLPFLFFGVPKYSAKRKLHKVVLTYIILAIATLVTGLVSTEIYYPTKAAALMTGCAFVSYCVFDSIKNERDLQVLNDGVIIGTLMFSVIVLFLLYDGGFAFNYTNEDSWLGKNLLSLNFFAGAVCAAMNFKMLKKYKYLVALIAFTLLIVLSTSLKIIIAVLFLLFVSFLNLENKTKAYVLIVMALAIIIVLPYAAVFFDSQEWTILSSRVLVLMGLDDYAVIQTEFVEGRENLMTSAMNVFYNHPLGVGLENTRLYMGTYSHNTVIELLCGSFILLFIYLLFLFKIARQIFLYRKHNPLFVLSLGVFIAIMFVSGAMRIYDNAVAIFMLFLAYTCNPAVLQRSNTGYNQTRN